MVWAFPIRFILEEFLSNCIAVGIGLASLNFDGENGSELFATVFCVVLGLILITFMIWVPTFYCRNLHKFDKEEFGDRWGEIYDGFRWCDDIDRFDTDEFIHLWDEQYKKIISERHLEFLDEELYEKRKEE